jgi:transposase
MSRRPESKLKERPSIANKDNIQKIKEEKKIIREEKLEREIELLRIEKKTNVSR